MNKKKTITVSIAILLTAIIAYFFYPREKDPHLGAGLLEEGSKIANILSISLSPGGFHPLTGPKQLRTAALESSKRLKKYSGLLAKLSSDPDLRKRKIIAPQVYLLFLEDSLRESKDSMNILFGYPIIRKLNANLPKIPVNNKNKNKWRGPYGEYLTLHGYLRGQSFMRRNKASLERIEKRFGVLKEYITSILFIETKFGDIPGDNHVLSVYNTLYHLNKKDVLIHSLTSSLEKHLEEKKARKLSFDLIAKYRPLLEEDNEKSLFSDIFSRSAKPGEEDRKIKSDLLEPALIKEIILELNENVKRRKDWGYVELKSLLLMAYEENYNVHELYGSFAGAFGLCQFLPSSYLEWARDGNSDGTINLHHLEDAMASTAFYLKNFGFDPNNRAKIRRSIYSYNHKLSYVNIVDWYARMLIKYYRVN
ncbi:MAG: lytic murein transglycosylase [Spirochaetota bacterium]|nr:lytic murein transglycosylase [Spirochaetota bacterium]